MTTDHSKAGQTVEEIVLDVDGEWMNSMGKRFVDSCKGPSHEECLIYRVYPALRKQNQSAYEPIAISIGPYHSGREDLQAMEAHKQRYLHDLLHQNGNPSVRLEQLVKLMKQKEKQVRSCCTEEIKLESNPFVEMLLLDGCFIVGLLLKLEDGLNNDDFLSGPGWRLSYVINDLLLLENQLPFFILGDIFGTLNPDLEDPLTELETLSFQFPKLTIPILDRETPQPGPFYHLLHLLHAHLIQESYSHRISDLVSPCLSMFNDCCKSAKSTCLSMFNDRWKSAKSTCLSMFNNRWKSAKSSCLSVSKDSWKSAKSEEQNARWIPCATMLNEAGIKFKAGGKNLLDIKFNKDNGVMEIPRIQVYDLTDARLRNLIAFEQCCLTCKRQYFTSYVALMDCIVNTSKDVEILHKNGILIHGLGSDDAVAHLFNNLNKDIFIDYEVSYISDTFKEVNEYRSRRIPKWRASLRHKYFQSPWALLSLMAAILILLLTMTQTVFCILSYPNLSKP